MIEVFKDIEALESALTALETDHSESAESAKNTLRKMLQDKIIVAEQFESDLEDLFNNVPL